MEEAVYPSWFRHLNQRGRVALLRLHAPGQPSLNHPYWQSVSPQFSFLQDHEILSGKGKKKIFPSDGKVNRIGD